jgi:excisionase family DNA binding protein
MAEPWSSVEEIAAHLGVARETVYRWIEQKGLPAHRIGKFWKFKISEVDEWIRAGGAADGPPDSVKDRSDEQ